MSLKDSRAPSASDASPFCSMTCFRQISRRGQDPSQHHALIHVCKNVSSLFHSVIYLFSRCLDAIFCIIVVARLSLFPRQWINKAVQSYLVWLFFFFLADRLRFLQQEQQKETRDARTCCSDVSSTHRYLSTNTQ